MNKRITRKLCIVGLISSIVLSGCGNAGITGGNREELSGGTDKVVSLKVWTEKDGLDVMNKMLDSFKEQYKDEAELLDKADDVDKVYVEKVLPEKMKYNLESIKKFSFMHDIGTMIKTVFAVIR